MQRHSLEAVKERRGEERRREKPGER